MQHDQRGAAEQRHWGTSLDALQNARQLAPGCVVMVLLLHPGSRALSPSLVRASCMSACSEWEPQAWLAPADGSRTILPMPATPCYVCRLCASTEMVCVPGGPLEHGAPASNRDSKLYRKYLMELVALSAGPLHLLPR